ncbi:MAG: efflux RND transporter permease subunit [Verrucomicrobiales bacterium]|nr:efflux RND transporter permease subunit [Verrucomicrobiales bacterium]MCP5525431.1 efflux RND transporter permease subunit [Verrucomicrobiales bacterium]
MKNGVPASHFTTDRPVAVLMVFTAAVVFGFFSFKRLPVTLMPELTYPTLTVRTEYAGAAPEEVENEISRPIEEALGVIGGLNKISSISRAGISDVVMEFVWGTDMSKAAQETLEKLDLVFLPREAERPLILRFDPALDPILELSLSGQGAGYEGEAGLRRLRRIAELQVKRALEPIPGVAAVRVRGGLEEEFQVRLDKPSLVRVGLSVQQVIDRLRQENINVAGGTLKEGRAEYMVRTLNEYENLEQIGETIVTRIDDRDVRIKDLGQVVRAQRDREIITRTDGRESVQIDLYKEADANIVAVAKAVRAAVGEGQTTQAAAPRGPGPGHGRGGGPRRDTQMALGPRLLQEESARIEVVADRSLFIESSINEVRSTAVLGGLLAVAVLYLFLADGRTTAIIGVSIPMSLLITFAPLNLLGLSLNIMSLGGLALGVGMLVDNSIVVLESIFRCREEGDDLVQAAIRGTREVKGAVVASTLTTVAVFFPLVFVEGIAGQAFGDLGVAVVTSLLASLMVAVYFIPMLASRRGLAAAGGATPGVAPSAVRGLSAWRDFQTTWRGAAGSWRRILAPWWGLRLVVGLVFELLGRLLMAVVGGVFWILFRVLAPLAVRVGRIGLAPVAGWFKRVLDGLNRAYPRVIESAIDRPLSVFLAVALVAALAWQVAFSLGSELLPEVHQGEFTFEVSLPVGTPIERTSAALDRVERAILADKQDIDKLLVTFGYDITNMKRSDEGEHSARFKVLLKPTRTPVATEERVLHRLRRDFVDLPDVEVRLVRPVLFSSKAPIVVEIEGDDLVELKRLSQQAVAVLGKLPELADVEATLRSGAPEIQVVYDRNRLITYGLNIGTVARQVRDLVKGYEATRFNLKDRRIPIVVRLEEADREQLADIAGIVVNPGSPQPIPLGAVAALNIGEGPSEIRRIDGQRVALIQANVGEGSLGSAVTVIDRALRGEIEWPATMRFAITGQNEEWEKSEGSLYLALALSLFLVYVIMAAQFESLVHPLVIMVTIPLAFIGSVLGLWVVGTSVSIVVFLGLIMLAGIVVNNAIVLVDYANTLRARGLSLREATVTAGRVRLRPILLTTATTVLGLLPMALGLGDGAEIRTPMAITVIFGLASSTVLTLVIIPTFYHLVAGWRDRVLGTMATEGAEPAPNPAP